MTNSDDEPPQTDDWQPLQPDWHCVPHGTWGDGEYDCHYCKTEPVFLTTW